MCYLRILLAASAWFSQNPKPAEKAADGVAPSVAKAPEAVETPSQPPPLTPEADSELDEYVREVADKIDEFPYVDAKIVQTIRAGERLIPSRGIYKKGPGYRMRFELNVELGEAKSQRIQVCDGKIGYTYDSFLGQEHLRAFDLSVIMPLVERKQIDEPIRQQLLGSLPFLRTGDMLRGFLRTLTFVKRETGKLGTKNPRDVIVLEGRWRQQFIPLLSGSNSAREISQIGGITPQYARLYLDSETEWPLRIELFRRDPTVELKPIYALEFENVDLVDKLPDSDFEFQLPDDVDLIDVTEQLASRLEGFLDKDDVSGEAPTPGGVSDVVPAVSNPIENDAKKKTAPKKTQ